MTRPIDPVALSQALIRCPSVTPEDAGALDVLHKTLEGLGFTCHRLPFSEAGTPDVDNLYARIGDSGPHFCFAGHTDVVPVGDHAAWTVDPFAGTIRDDMLWGRGASDMKAAIACMASAVAAFIDQQKGAMPGSISFLITGDEEGPAINGTVKMLEWLKARGETIDACLVGEPTNVERIGDTVKIGRRGSMNGILKVAGVQGHTAYPQLADNPVPRMVRMLNAITAEPLDAGSDHFQASNLEITTVDVGNAATNVIPAKATAGFNIRFNDLHDSAAIEKWLRARFDAAGGDYDLSISVSGESFLTPPGRLSNILGEAINRVVGEQPVLSTSGGTSDARFIKDLCPVAEFGMTNATAHKVDERVPIDDIHLLTAIYGTVLNRFFSEDAPPKL
ncbi:MAG: succinyl-diaminopimelate desuccinylase [Rhodospirillales bacterium]|nr:succinyl-diaminopimelate desuccinylase [Rhodospirillales bacterium]